MKIVIRIVFIICLMPFSIYGADLTECFQKNTLEMSFCIQKLKQNAAVILTKKEQNIKEIISKSVYTPKGDDENAKLRAMTLESFEEAQTRWKSFRDSDCKFIYNHYQYGSMRNVMYQQCLLLRTEERIESLNNFNKWKY